VTDVHVESASLDDGVPVMYLNSGEQVRLAFDPQQITEDRALALLFLYMPELLGRARLHTSHQREAAGQ
jgi:hypothetical protein